MLKKTLIIIPLLVILSILLVVILYWQTNLVSDFGKNILNQNLGTDVHIEYSSISGDLFNHVIIKDLEISLSSGVYIRSNYVKMSHSLSSTIAGDYFFQDVLIDSLDILIPDSDIEDTVVVEDIEKRNIQQTLNHIASSIPLKNFIQSLPQFSFDELSINHGRIDIASINRTFDNINLHLNAFHRGSSIELNIEKLSGIERSVDFNLEFLHGQIIGNEKRINLNQLEIKTGDSHLFGHAEITIGDSLWVIIGLEDTRIALSDIETVSGLRIADSGLVDLSLDLVGNPNRFSAIVSCKGNFNQYRTDSLIVDGDYRNGEIILQRGLLIIDSSQANFKGKIAKQENILDMTVKHFDLASLQYDSVHSDLSGSMRLFTESVGDPLKNGSVNILLTHSRIDTSQIDTLKLAAISKDHQLELIEPSFVRIGDQSVFTFKGSMDRKKNLDLRISTEKNNVKSLTQQLGIPILNGTIDANIFISGIVDDPNVEGYLWVPHIEWEAFTLDSMIVQLDIKNLRSRRQGRGLILASHWQYDSLEINQTITNVIFDSNRVVIDTLLFANNKNYITSTGFLEANEDTIDLVFTFFRLNYENAWMENEGNLAFRITPQEYTIESAIFKESNDGIIEIRGFWDTIYDEMQFGMHLERINFSPFRQFMNENFSLSGTVDADFELVNPLRDLELDVELRGKDLEINEIPLGEVTCKFVYANEALYVDDFKMVYGDATVDVDGDIAITLRSGTGEQKFNLLEESFANLQIYWKNLRLENYFAAPRWPKPPQGNISGHLSLAGTIAEPRGQLTLFGEHLSYDKFRSDSLNISAEFSKDSLVVNRIALDLNDTDIWGSGWQRLNLDFSNLDSIITGLPFELTLVSKDDKVSFIGNFLDQVERLEGPYEASFTFSGTLDKPSLRKGYFKMDDGQIILSRVRNPIRELEIDATIENSLLTLNHFSAFAQKDKDFWDKTFGIFNKLFRLIRGETRTEGGLYGEGSIALDDVRRPNIDISLETYKLYLDYFVENTNFLVSTDNLHIFGRDTLNITGDLTIDDGNYIVDLTNLRKNIYLTSKTVEKERPITWNLEITIPGNFTIASSKLDLLNNFDFEIMGDLRTIQEANIPWMDLTGHLEIISGKYGSWGQNFGIRSGSIDFTDPKVINPDIDIRAEKRAGDYIVVLALTGNLEEMIQDIRIKDINGNFLTNLTDQEILSLISLGTKDFNVADAGEHVISTSVETALERGTEALTGLDRVEIQSKSGKLIDFESKKLNQGLKDASVSLGKYLTSDLYVEYTGMFGSSATPAPTLNWRPGNQIGIEYRINKNWSVDSYYLRTYRGNNIYNVSLAWKLSF